MNQPEFKKNKKNNLKAERWNRYRRIKYQNETGSALSGARWFFGALLWIS